MRLDIDADCFDSVVRLRLVLDLIHLVQSERHEWVPSSRTVLAADDYFEAVLGDRRHETPEYELVRKKLKMTAYRSADAIEEEAVVEGVPISAQLLADLVHDLSRPAVVVVEDQFNDGAFLIWQARLFVRDRILRAEKEGWLEFDHSGGSGRVPTIGYDHIRRFRCLTRIVVVIDGDVTLPDRDSEHESKLAELRRRDIRVHIWPGREVENFLSTRILAHGMPHNRRDGWADAVRALPWRQRGLIDMKKGLPNLVATVPAQWTPDHDALFADLSDDHRTALTSQGCKPPTHEMMRGMSATLADRQDLPPEAQQAIEALLDLIESVL